MSPHRSVIMESCPYTNPDILDILYSGEIALQKRQSRKMFDSQERCHIGPSGLDPFWDLNWSYSQQILHNQDASSSSSYSSYLPQVLVAHRVQVMSGSQAAHVIDLSSALNPPITPSELASFWSEDDISLTPDETSSQHSNPVTILDIDEVERDESGGISTPENEFDIESIYSVFIQSVSGSPAATQSPTLFDSPRTFAAQSFVESYPKITVSVDRHTLPSYWFPTTSSEAEFTQPPPPYCTEQIALAYGYSSFLAGSMRPGPRSEEGHVRRGVTRRKLPKRAFIWGLKAVRALRRQVGGWVTGVPPHLYA